MKHIWSKIKNKFIHLDAVDWDIYLYGLSAVFAFLTVLAAVSTDYRIWGVVAGFSYLAGLLGSLVIKFFLRKKTPPFYLGVESSIDAASKNDGENSPSLGYEGSGSKETSLLESPSILDTSILNKSFSISGSTYSTDSHSQSVPETAGHLSDRKVRFLRYFLLVFVLFTSLLAPLVTELIFSANADPGANAQPEVAVIERAGDRLMAGHDIYLKRPTSVGVSPHSDNKNIDSSSYFPYLPSMAIFGLANAGNLPPEFGDARLLLSIFTVAVVLYALKLLSVPGDSKVRILQIFLILPTGALPLVTGGDDLPVLALMLLGVVYSFRKEPLRAGLAIGLATTLKFTAWPLAFLLCFVIRGRGDKPSYIKFITALSSVLIPVLLIAIAPSPESFIVNVIRFPLGLSKVSSPAASPLLGQVLVSIFHGEKKAVTYMLLGIGILAVVLMFIKYRPKNVSEAARFASFVMFLATVLAPATRFGYLIYPVNLFTWSLFLNNGGNHHIVISEDESKSDQSQLASFIS